MSALLFRVTGGFSVGKRGYVITGLVDRSQSPLPGVGDSIEIRFPGGSSAHASILGIEGPAHAVVNGMNYGIMIPPRQQKIPAGAEVWF